MKITLVIFLFLLAGCIPKYPLSWSAVPIKDLWKVLPENPDQCNDRLDTLFSPLAKKHFKELPEQVAVIEICHQLESGFISGWHLVPNPVPYTATRRPLDIWTEVHGMSPNSSLSVYFVSQGITDPPEMLRIIFTSYHRKINGKDPGLQDIIDAYKTYWSNSRRYITPEGMNSDTYEIHLAIRKQDDSILNSWFFYKIHLMDTLTVAYSYENYRFTKKPMDYSIKAVIAQADTAQNASGLN